MQNAIERACVLGKPPLIQVSDLRLNLQSSKDEYAGCENAVIEELGTDTCLKTALKKFKKTYVRKILELEKWNQTKAAKVLGIQRTYVSRLINELEIQK